MDRCPQCNRPILSESALKAGGGMPEYCLALEDERDTLAAALAASRERHAADARDLDQLRVTARDESARAHAAEVEVDTLRASIASWKVEEEEWKRREAELLAEVEQLRNSRDLFADALADALEGLLADRTDTYCEFCHQNAPKHYGGPRNGLPRGPIPHADGCPQVAAEAALKLAGRLPE